MSIEKTCPYCQNNFQTYRNDIIYCSKPCQSKGVLIKYKEYLNDPNRYVKPKRKEKIIKKCDDCGDEHTRLKSFLCKKCHAKIKDKKRYEERKKDPKLYEFYLSENRLKNQRELRKNRGLSLEYPPLRKKDGEGSLNSEGYRIISRKNHPNSLKNGTILEHKFIMSEHLGRPLSFGENVHHKNGIRHDNRIENLELWSVRQPIGQRVEDRIQFYKEFLSEYGYDVIKRT